VGANAGRIALVGVDLAPFAGIAFLWFIAVVRNLIGDREDRFFATVFLDSGLLFVGDAVHLRRVGAAAHERGRERVPEHVSGHVVVEPAAVQRCP